MISVSPIKIILALILWLVCIAGALAVYVGQWFYSDASAFPKDTVYVIEKGSSLHAVARDLNEKGVIKWPKLWVYYARAFDLASIKAGEYAMEEVASPVSILEKFNEGKVVQYSITFVEGASFKEILNVLQNNDKLNAELDASQDVLAQLKANGINVDHPEGWFFPDTYQFASGDSDISILSRAHEKMKFVLSSEWMNREDDLPYNSSYEALVMASIVEKETGVPYERPEIAGVFVRRLRKGMRLQTDPTVIYGMGENYKGNIRRKDLREPTPYNTYVIKGLPPTPIASPGREAINAALHPKAGETLFFVAKGDGTHYFSVTNEEHNRAVRKYQKQRRENYRSAPPPSSSQTPKQKEKVSAEAAE